LTYLLFHSTLITVTKRRKQKKMIKLIQTVETLPDNFTGIVEDADGKKCWYLNGLLHRVDGPAVEYADGTKCWYLNGKRHRTDGPAIEYADGPKYWYLNGKELTKEEFDAMNTTATCSNKVVEIDGKKYRLVEL
jgi:hypothetical protein